MSRTDQLHDRLVVEFGNTVIFAVDPPNDAGLHFGLFGEWRIIAHVEQLTVMAEALSDIEFLAFQEAVCDLCRNVLALADDEDELDNTILDAQHLVAESHPDLYAVLDAVFALDR